MGYHIYCGEFHGEDDSLSAIRGIIAGLSGLAESEAAVGMLALLASEFDDDPPYVQINGPDAEILLPLLLRYRECLAAEIGPVEKPSDAVRIHDGQQGEVDDFGHANGLGWQYWGVHDFIAACQLCARCRKPVVITRS